MIDKFRQGLRGETPDSDDYLYDLINRRLKEEAADCPHLPLICTLRSENLSGSLARRNDATQYPSHHGSNNSVEYSSNYRTVALEAESEKVINDAVS